MLTRYEINQKSEFEIERGVHRFSSLFLLLQGEFEYEAKGERHRILPFQPVLFQKGVSFYKKVLSPIEYIHISGPSMQREGHWLLSYGPHEQERIRSTAHYLKKAIEDRVDLQTIEHFAEDFLFVAQTEALEKRELALGAVYAFIEEHLDQPIAVSSLAALAGCSVQALIRKFKIDCGKTPARCIAELRILKAKDLLADTDLPVAEIADLCGYENVYYFSNSFKKETGLSPTNFRHAALL